MMWVYLCIPRHIHCSCSTVMSYTHIATCMYPNLFAVLFLQSLYTPFKSNNYVWVGQINIGTLVVKGYKYKFVDDSPALTKSYSVAVSCPLVLWLLMEFKEKKKKQKRTTTWTNGKNYNFGQMWYFSAKFGIQLSLTYKIIELKVRTGFSNVRGEYKYHSNPYIQGTTVPCDIIHSALHAHVCVQCTTKVTPFAFSYQVLIQLQQALS